MDSTVITNSAHACRRFRALGLATLEEASVLFSVAEQQELGASQTVSDVANFLTIPMSSASRVIWGLVQRKLMRLDAAPGDRRKKIVRVDVARASALLKKRNLI